VIAAARLMQEGAEMRDRRTRDDLSLPGWKDCNLK
jgi:hypothetical protein